MNKTIWEKFNATKFKMVATNPDDPSDTIVSVGFPVDFIEQFHSDYVNCWELFNGREATICEDNGTVSATYEVVSE